MPLYAAAFSYIGILVHGLYPENHRLLSIVVVSFGGFPVPSGERFTVIRA